MRRHPSLPVSEIFFFFGIALVASEPNVLSDVVQKFTSNFLQNVVNEQQARGSNPDIVMSGFSVLPPLAQLTLATQGESHEELLDALKLPRDTVVREVFEMFKQVIDPLQDVLVSANKVYVSFNTEVNGTLAAELNELFSSEFSALDFTNTKAAAEEINNYVELNTNRKVKNVVDHKDLKPNTDVFLVNTLYFQNEWENQFDKEQTHVDDFYYANNSKPVKKYFMHQDSYYNYGFNEELDAQIIQLEYKTPGFYFHVALPKAIDGLPALLKKLHRWDKNLYQESRSYPVEYVEVSLPKFNVSTHTDLKAVLQNLGVSTLFKSDYGNLRRLLLSQYPVAVSDAVQKLFLSIDEFGTEAGAANDFPAVPRAKIAKPNVFIANHPFYYEINYNKYTLFSGTINFDQLIH